MNNLCDRLNLLDFNKWNCLILLCGAIKLIIYKLKNNNYYNNNNNNNNNNKNNNNLGSAMLFRNVLEA